MRYLRSLVAAAALSVAAAGAAGAAVLDFSGPICGGVACGNGSFIDQSYGDVPGLVDVTYDAAVGSGGLDPASFWSTGYETLVGVAYSAFGGGLGISFEAAAGKTVTINSFDIAPYLDRPRDSRVQVIDLAAGTLLFDTGTFRVSTLGVTNFADPGNWTSSRIQIVLGPDAFDVGIDNIDFTVNDANGGGGVQPIPLPATAWLLLGGVAALAARGRRAA